MTEAPRPLLAAMIPTYNEAETIGPLAAEILALDSATSGPVVDDDSLDDGRDRPRRGGLIPGSASFGPSGGEGLGGIEDSRPPSTSGPITSGDGRGLLHHPRFILLPPRGGDIVIGSRFVLAVLTRTAPPAAASGRLPLHPPPLPTAVATSRRPLFAAPPSRPRIPTACADRPDRPRDPHKAERLGLRLVDIPIELTDRRAG
jgi:hypothetical protein